MDFTVLIRLKLLLLLLLCILIRRSTQSTKKFTFPTNLPTFAHLSQENLESFKGHFCGHHLANMLSVICEGKYNRKKREIDENNENEIFYPFVEKKEAVSMLKEFRKRAVAEECCLKPCSFKEMYSYCAG